MREALLAPRVPCLELEAGEPVAADELVPAALGRDEVQAPCGRAVRGGAGTSLAVGECGGVHAQDDRARGAPLRWPVVQETTSPGPPGWRTLSRGPSARRRAAPGACRAPTGGRRARWRR